MKVPRNGQGRPWIAHEGKVKCYSRASNYASPLKDMAGLGVHNNKLVAKGLMADPAIGQAAVKNGLMKLGTERERDEDVYHGALCALTERAIDVAGGNRKSTLGTLIHEASEHLDSTGVVPMGLYEQIRPYGDDLEAYIRETDGLTSEEVETFVVHDERKVAGTLDRIYRADEPINLTLQGRSYTLPPGRYIGDLKTGSLDYTPGVFAVQLALYAFGLRYACLHDPVLDDRGNPSKEGCLAGANEHGRHPLDVSRDVGLLVHLPLGKGECHIYPINLDFGRRSMELVSELKRWRSTKVLDTVYGDIFLT